jgi:poly(A) polymerase
MMKTYSHPELVIKFPQEVKTLFSIFGDNIRLVGGSTRDLLLNKELHDFDFATKFLPQEIVEILQKNKIKSVPTGIKFGTITAVINGKNFEITTLRKDSKDDGRHCEVEFVDDYFLDAQRRDFTINALYLDSKGLVTDYFDGIADLNSKNVKFIGDANLRIEEDFLRILRFFRFSCNYAQNIDEEGLKACIKQKANLKKLSRERIRQEFLKIISSSKTANLIAILKILKSEKIIEEIISKEPDISALERLFVIEKELQFVASANLKLAVLFVEKGFDLKSFSAEICATNLEKKYLQFMCESHDLQDLKRLLLFEEKLFVQDFYLLNLAKNFDFAQISQAKENLQLIQNFTLPPFPLNGDVVAGLGFREKEIGSAINLAKKVWAESGFTMSRLDLTRFLTSNK